MHIDKGMNFKAIQAIEADLFPNTFIFRNKDTK